MYSEDDGSRHFSNLRSELETGGSAVLPSTGSWHACLHTRDTLLQTPDCVLLSGRFTAHRRPRHAPLIHPLSLSINWLPGTDVYFLVFSFRTGVTSSKKNVHNFLPTKRNQSTLTFKRRRKYPPTCGVSWRYEMNLTFTVFNSNSVEETRRTSVQALNCHQNAAVGPPSKTRNPKSTKC